MPWMDDIPFCMSLIEDLPQPLRYSLVSQLREEGQDISAEEIIGVCVIHKRRGSKSQITESQQSLPHEECFGTRYNVRLQLLPLSPTHGFRKRTAWLHVVRSDDVQKSVPLTLNRALVIYPVALACANLHLDPNIRPDLTERICSPNASRNAIAIMAPYFGEERKDDFDKGDERLREYFDRMGDALEGKGVTGLLRTNAGGDRYMDTHPSRVNVSGAEYLPWSLLKGGPQNWSKEM